MLDLLVGLAQFTIHAISLGKNRVPCANDHGKPRRIEQSPAIEVQQQPFNCTHHRDHGQADECGGLGAETKREHRRRKNEKRAGPAIDGQEQHSQKHHSANVDGRSRALQRKQTKIEKEKYSSAREINQPDAKAGMTHDGIDEKEAQVNNPEQRTPSVIFILDYRSPRFQLPRTSLSAWVVAFERNQWHASIFAPRVNSGHCAISDQRRTIPARPRGSAQPESSYLRTMRQCQAQLKTRLNSMIFWNSRSYQNQFQVSQFEVLQFSMRHAELGTRSLNRLHHEARDCYPYIFS